MKPSTYTNPYVGLKPFDTEDSLFFFGRKQQTAELLKKLHQTRFLAVVGTSGCGKSSLIRAGLIPYLKAGFLVEDRDQWCQIVMNPGMTPLHALIQAISNAFPESDNSTIDIQSHIEQIKKTGLRYIVDCISAHVDGEQTNILLVVDQFEEIFDCLNQAKNNEQKDNARKFVSIMLGLSTQRILPVYSVLTMRSDFLGDCDRFYGLPETMNQSQYLVPRMSRGQRMEAIKGPSALLAVQLSDRLIQRLLNDSSENPDHLPVLQHALMRTWDIWQQSNDPQPDIRHYETIGTMDRALSIHANKIYDALNDRQQFITEKLFKVITHKTVSGKGIRRPKLLSDLYTIVNKPSEDIRTVIDQFRQSGCTFLFPHHDQQLADNDEINITHESLMRRWDRLIQWVDEEAESARWYARLLDRARLKKEEKGAFLNDTELIVLMDWKTSQNPNHYWAMLYGGHFDLAMDYLEASETDANERKKQQELIEKQKKDFEKTQQQATFQRKIARTVSFFLIIALFLACFAGYQYYAADQARIISENARKDAEQANIISENARRDAEQARAQTEIALKKAKEQRQIAEKKRKEADAERELAQNRLQEILQLQKTLNPLEKKQGRLYVSAIPKNAIIKIEGIEQAYANGMKLNKGEYSLTIRHEDYFSKTMNIKIEAGKENQVRAELKPKPGQITILGQPKDTAIYYRLKDDLKRPYKSIKKEKKTYQIADLQPGKYQIRVEKTGFETFEQSIDLSPNETEKIMYTLQESACLTVTVNPEKSTIKIMNIKPVYQPGMYLSPGKYLIQISKINYEMHEDWVSLNAGEKKELNIVLIPEPGNIQITGQPTGADIYVNSEYKGQSNLLLKGLKSGSYSIRIEKIGYQLFQKDVVIIPNETVTLRYSLKAIETFQKAPSGYMIELDTSD
jgi:Skp family chaperone for outer membrane proteins